MAVNDRLIAWDPIDGIPPIVESGLAAIYAAQIAAYFVEHPPIIPLTRAQYLALPTPRPPGQVYAIIEGA